MQAKWILILTKTHAMRHLEDGEEEIGSLLNIGLDERKII